MTESKLEGALPAAIIFAVLSAFVYLVVSSDIAIGHYHQARRLARVQAAQVWAGRNPSRQRFLQEVSLCKSEEALPWQGPCAQFLAKSDNVSSGDLHALTQQAQTALDKVPRPSLLALIAFP